MDFKVRLARPTSTVRCWKPLVIGSDQLRQYLPALPAEANQAESWLRSMETDTLSALWDAADNVSEAEGHSETPPASIEVRTGESSTGASSCPVYEINDHLWRDMQDFLDSDSGEELGEVDAADDWLIKLSSKSVWATPLLSGRDDDFLYLWANGTMTFRGNVTQQETGWVFPLMKFALDSQDVDCLEDFMKSLPGPEQFLRSHSRVWDSLFEVELPEGWIGFTRAAPQDDGTSTQAAFAARAAHPGTVLSVDGATGECSYSEGDIPEHDEELQSVLAALADAIDVDLEDLQERANEPSPSEERRGAKRALSAAEALLAVVKSTPSAFVTPSSQGTPDGSRGNPAGTEGHCAKTAQPGGPDPGAAWRILLHRWNPSP